MRFWTGEELITKVEQDLDLEDELFIQPSEMLAYANEAIDEAEAEICGVYEDYFLSKSTLSLASGTDEYTLPSTIYAHKIRRVIFNDGNTSYTVDRIRDWKKFEVYTNERIVGSSDLYRYFIYNATAGSPKLLLTPPARETGAYLDVWFIRNANRLVDLTDVCDIPEFANFVIQFMKVRCYEKEMHPNLQTAIGVLQQQRELMKATLSTMVPDADNTIELDLSSYEEQV